MSTKTRVYKPRNDFVVFRIEKVDEVKGLYMPQRSAEGTRNVVEVVGPKVEGLKAGDVVEIIGEQGSFARLRGETSLYITKEANIALIIEENGEESIKEVA